MAMDTQTGNGLRVDINVTPLVDVVLVLLIIFMVLTPATLKHLTAKVPEVADKTAQTVPNDLAIVVHYSKERELTLNTEPVAIEGLQAKLRERLHETRKKVVFFRAADELPYGEVVHLMDLARGAGAETLAVITQLE